MTKETPEESFTRKLESTIKRVLKPAFDQISSRFDQVDSRFDKMGARLDTSDKETQGKLSQIMKKLG